MQSIESGERDEPQPEEAKVWRWVEMSVPEEQAELLFSILSIALSEAQDEQRAEISGLIEALKCNAIDVLLPVPPVPSLEVSKDHPF